MDNLSEHSSDWTTSDTHSSQLSSSDSPSLLPSHEPAQGSASSSGPIQPAEGTTITTGSIQPAQDSTTTAGITSMGPPPNPLSPPPLTYEGDSPPDPIIKDGIGIDPADNDA